MSQWYAVQTQSRAEDRALYHLKNQGYTVFLPRYRRRRRHARRTDTVLRPLFPGYLFVSFDTELQPWRPINGTVGVIRLVCNGSDPIPVPEDVMTELLGRADANGEVKVETRGILPGEKVEIVSGPFAECDAIFETAIDEQRVILLLNLMGRQVRTKVPADALAIAV